MPEQEGDFESGAGAGPAAAWAIRLGIASVIAAAGLAVWAGSFPFQISYVEGYLLEQGARLAGGGQLYRPLSGSPWIIDNFPPGYVALMAGIVKVGGVHFGAARLLTFAAVAGLGVLLVAWLRRTQVSLALSWAVLGLWVLSPFVIQRALLVRLDFLALLLSGIGLATFLRLEQRRPAIAIAASSLLFLAAIMTRQTAVAAPTALILALWLQGQRIQAIRLAALLGALVGLALAGLQLASNGGFFVHAIQGNIGPYQLQGLARKTVRAAFYHAPLFIAAIFGLRTTWRRNTLEARIRVIWFATALLTSLTVGKPGSSANHYLELLFVAALLAGAGLQQIRLPLRWPTPGLRNPHAIAVAFIALQLLVTAASGPLQTSIAVLSDRHEEASLVNFLQSTQGPILSENAGAALLAGHDVVFEPRTFLELHRAGRWDDSVLVAQIQAHAYGAIVLEDFPPGAVRTLGFRFTPNVWDALNDNYVPAHKFGRWIVLEPTAVAST